MGTIVRLTFREMLNKKILYLGLLMTVVYLGFFGLAMYSMRDGMNGAPPLTMLGAAATVMAMGLFVSGMLVSGITIFSAVGSISAEIENGIIQAIAAKPLSRSAIFLGKFIGLGITVVGYSLLIFLATTGIVRYFFDLDMASYPQGLVLFCLQPLVLLAVTMWGSTFMTTLGNGITMFVFYSLSVVGGMVEQIGVQLSSVGGMIGGSPIDASSLSTIGILSSLLLPTDSMYRLVNFTLLYKSSVPVEALNFNPFSTITPPSVWMMVYSGIYLLAFLYFGIRTFTHRDI
ncbi:MAG: ABC transporter permease [Ignavibacteriales bacterium]